MRRTAYGQRARHGRDATGTDTHSNAATGHHAAASDDNAATGYHDSRDHDAAGR